MTGKPTFLFLSSHRLVFGECYLLFLSEDIFFIPLSFLLYLLFLVIGSVFFSSEDAKKIFKERVPGADKQIDRLFDVDLFEILQPIEENVKLLSKLKKKYNLYILSNFHQPAFEHIFKKYEFFRLFDGHTVSCYYYLLKPEKEIYDTLINKFNLIPKETVFIDDTKVNIDACEKEGIRGIHLPDYTELEQKLEEFLK